MLLRLALMALLLAGPVRGESWDETLAAAKGQTVYWNAWGGDQRTNAFINWVGREVSVRYGVTVEGVRLGDTGEAVARVLAEKAAGRDRGGSVDLIWINGGNFRSMKHQGLLYGPFLDRLPNARFLDLDPGGPNLTDFTIPTEGYESPWRLARFVLTYDSTHLADPPRSAQSILDWAQAHPGRFTHPTVANFMGSTFLKQMLVELAPDPAVLTRPPTDESFAAATAPLWAWYDALRPALWREGRSFPENESVQMQMLDDGEIDFTMAFDPAAAANAVAQGLLPPTVRSYALDQGTIGNVSFVAIPYNAAHPEGAMVVANFLLDPATQAHAQDMDVLGALSVLDPARLDPAQKASFAALPSSAVLPDPATLGRTLAEPHPDWADRLVREWARRYAE